MIILCRYIGRKIGKVDERLLQIRMPSTVTRSPRSITERKFWKGWLIYAYGS